MTANYNFQSIPTLDQEGVDVDKQDLKANIEALVERGLSNMPASQDMAGLKGRPYVIDPSETGPTVDAPMNLGSQPLIGYKSGDPETGEETGAALTIDASNADRYCGRDVTFNRATAQTVTIVSTAGAGFNFSWWVKGAGQVTFVAGSGLTLRPSVTGHSKSANQYAVGGIQVKADGVSLSLFGNTSA